MLREKIPARHNILACFILFAIPFKRTLNFDFSYFHLSIVEILTVFSLPAILLAKVARNATWRKEEKTCLILFSILLMMALISVLEAKNIFFVFRFAVSLVISFSLFLYFARSVKDISSLQTTVKLLLTSLLILAISSTVSTSYTLFTSGYWSSEAGLYNARNELTFHILIGYVISLVFTVLPLEKRGKITVFHFYGFLFLLTLFLSRGRAATLIAITLTIFILLFFTKKRVINFLSLALILSLVVIFSVVNDGGQMLNALYDRYFYSIFHEYEMNYGSLAARQIALGASMSMIDSNPITGIGGGNFGLTVLEYGPFLKEDTINPHNTYLGLAAQTGLVSLLGFGILLIFCMTPFNKKRLRNDRQRKINIALTFALIGCCGHMLSFDALLSPILWVLLALCFASRQNLEPANEIRKTYDHLRMSTNVSLLRVEGRG